MKIKRIKLNGFRGMLRPQELNFTRKGASIPCSLVLYGLNSSGKTSFVDGLEWFLSFKSEIEWLNREDAKQRAYPHQAVNGGESFVEIEFSDSEKKISTLRKIFNHKRITQPDLSSVDDFKHIYEAFIIKPFLRYLEVIDFVYNRTGLEKYQKLANWMGFESELAFQEKISLEIFPELKRKEKQLIENVSFLEKGLCELIGNNTPNKSTILSFCNAILKDYEIEACTNLSELWQHISEISKSKISSSVGLKIDKLTEAETTLSAFNFDINLVNEVEKIKVDIEKFKKEQKLIEKIDIINLYTQALEILNRTTETKVRCPVCGVEWQREKLLAHIQQEFSYLKRIKDNRYIIFRKVNELKSLVKKENEKSKQIFSKYKEIQKLMPGLNCEKIKEYCDSLDALEVVLQEDLFVKKLVFSITKKDITELNGEMDLIKKNIIFEKNKIQLSKEELKLSEDIEKLKQIKNRWHEILSANDEVKFTTDEIDKFVQLSNALVKLIQENIKNRFNEISDRIGNYFGILRSDKDIKNIEIVLKEEKGRATGRYYDISVKPAYKVLSESLLNSLGLAVYFTCIKQFNTNCKFIVLDDIMNSLDIENRDTVLDLIEQEFEDYQIILFTHDYYWFQKIIRRFPLWISKKIKGWDYNTGAKIDFAKTTEEEVEKLLADSTTIEDAGFKFGRHVEGILNELCENVEAEVKYRYTRNDPPSMEELFDALYKRLKNKAGQNHPATKKTLNAKKYEPLIRTFTAHPRDNYASTISQVEVKRAIKEWFGFEREMWCSNCRHYVEYFKKKNVIECYCGELKLTESSISNK
jgi:uncharacterized C2H2 Zn-finger protein